jgi:flagellar biosynthetic protein FliP
MLQRRREQAWQRVKRHASLQSIIVIVLGIVFCGGDWIFAQTGSRQQTQSNGIVRDQSNSTADASTTTQGDEGSTPVPFGVDVEQMVSPGGLSSTLKLMMLMTVLSLAPSILIMTTCFVRFVIVLGLLRQALGTQQLPPNQVIVSLCLFLTLLVMGPVWRQAYNEGIRPYTDPQPGEVQVDLATATQRTIAPIRGFMSDQIEKAENSDAIWMLAEFQRPAPGSPGAEEFQLPTTYDEVDLTVLLPAYMLSEIKTAFVIGFQLYLPFLIIDMVIASVLISMGMMMLPPVLISLPFKLLLFVLIDGWYLTVGMLLESVRPFG